MSKVNKTGKTRRCKNGKSRRCKIRDEKVKEALSRRYFFKAVSGSKVPFVVISISIDGYCVLETQNNRDLKRDREKR